MFEKIGKKILILILTCIIVIVVSLVYLHNYRNPNVAASIQDNYTWMKNVQVVKTDWYGNKGLTFFVANNNGEEFCKGYVSKNIFHTKTILQDCVPFTNKSKEGDYGTSLFFGKPIVSGFTLATTNVEFKDKEVKSYIYKNLKAWYVFSPSAEPTFHFNKSS